MSEPLKAPFPYFGGKASVAYVVWDALGDCKHYIEPFFGSGAVLLARPDYQPGVHVETINDADGQVANVWRALQASPDEVAKWCDWPVNHADLMARKRVLVERKGALLADLTASDSYCDPKLAGYWVWAASCWIGSGLTCPTCPNQRPHLADSGVGVHRLAQRDLNNGEGVQEPYNTNIYKWFRDLSERLRYVRVVCGDWTRVCGGNWQDKIGTVGIFFDPPYADKGRRNVYDTDCYEVAHAVRQWCIERGKSKSYRIVLAGYDEHDELGDAGWTRHGWEAKGGYANVKRNADSKANGKANAMREVLWMSPHCLTEPQLFTTTGVTHAAQNAEDRTAKRCGHDAFKEEDSYSGDSESVGVE